MFRYGMGGHHTHGMGTNTRQNLESFVEANKQLLLRYGITKENMFTIPYEKRTETIQPDYHWT